MRGCEMGLKRSCEALENKEISSRELVADCLKRIEETEPAVRALNTVCADEALAEALRSDGRRAKGEAKSALD